MKILIIITSLILLASCKKASTVTNEVTTRDEMTDSVTVYLQ